MKSQLRIVALLTLRAGARLYAKHQPQRLKIATRSERPFASKTATRCQVTSNGRSAAVLGRSEAARNGGVRSTNALVQTNVAAPEDGRSPFFAVTFAMLLPFIASNAIAAEKSASDDKPECCSKEHVETGPVSDKSLYHIESTWTTDAAVKLHLASFSGKPQIVTMFFASCNYACPILVHDMKRIEAALPKNLRDKVGMVLVSFDSERDTPEALATYRRVHGLKSNWTLVRGEPDDVLELGALLGIKFKKDSAGQFAHSNVITLLNAEGEIVSQQLGLNRDPGPIVAEAQKLFQASTD